jgi:hypothetical protein
VYGAPSTGAVFDTLIPSTAPSSSGSKKVAFHVANLKRPQDKFDVAPDNANAPFVLPPPVGAVDKPACASSMSSKLSAIEQHALQIQPIKKRHPLAGTTWP